MKPFELLVICMLFLSGIQLRAQEIIGRIDLNDPQQYHIIKFKGGPKFRAKIINIKDSMLTYIARGDTIKSAIEEVKYIRVYQKRIVKSQKTPIDTNRLVLLEMKNGTELKGNILDIKARDLSFRFHGQVLDLSLRSIQNAYLLQDSTEEKIATITLKNYTAFSHYFDERAPYFEEPILVVLRNGTQLVGRVEHMEDEKVHFRFQDKLLTLHPNMVRKAFFLKEGSREIDRKAYLFQVPFYGEGNSFVTPTAFLPGKHQIEYRTYYGLVHVVEGKMTDFSSLSVGYSLPDILIGRVKLAGKVGHKQYLSASATAIRSQIRDYFRIHALQGSYTVGSPSNHFFLSGGYLYYQDDFDTNKSFLASLGGTAKIGQKWNFNYEIFSFQDSYDAIIVMPTFTFGWLKKGNLFEFGIFGGVVDGFFGAAPYLSYSKRIYR